MISIPTSLKATWGVVKVLKIAEGLYSGLALFIATPYLYMVLENAGAGANTFFLTLVLVGVHFGLIALLEIPTGAIADTFGRVNSIILSKVASLIFCALMIVLFFFHNLVLVIIFVILARFISALHYTLLSGSFSAWLVDTMREKEPGFSFDRLLSRAQVITQFSMVVGGVFGITFYLYSVPFIAYVVMFLLQLGCLSYCLLSMVETSSLVFHKWEGRLLGLMASHTVKTIKMALSIYRNTRVILWLTIGFSSYALLLCLVNRLWPVVLGAQFGVNKWSWQWYTLALLVPLSSALAAKWLVRKGDKQAAEDQVIVTKNLQGWFFYFIYFSVFAVLILGVANYLGTINFPLFVVAILVVESSWSIVAPVFETLVCKAMLEEHAQERATVLSIASALQCFLVFIFIVPSSGMSAALSPVSWMLPAVIVLVVGLTVHYFIRKNQKAEKEFLNPQIPLEASHDI